MRRNGWRNFTSIDPTKGPSERMLKRADQIAPVLKDENWGMSNEALFEASVTILVGNSLDKSIPATVLEGAESLLSNHFGEFLGDELPSALAATKGLVQFMPGIAGDADDTDLSLEQRLASVPTADLINAISIAQAFANATRFDPIIPLTDVTKLVIETAFKDPNRKPS